MHFKTIAFAFGAAAVTAGAASAEPRCFQVESQQYCKAWAHDTPVSTQTEYVRAGDTVEHWKRMVTIVRYKKTGSLDEIVPTYMRLVQPYLVPAGAQPVFVKPANSGAGREAATRFLLSSGNDTEYTVAYFRGAAAAPAFSIVFSQHVTADFGVPPMARYGGWLRDLRAVKL